MDGILGSRFASPRLTSSHPRPWAISYKCVVNYLPRGRDTVLLHRCSSPPTLATSLLLHRPVTSTDCLPTAPSTPLFLSPAPSSALSLSFSHVISRSCFFPLRAVSSSTCRHLLLVLLLLLRHVMAPRVKETNVYLKN